MRIGGSLSLKEFGGSAARLVSWPDRNDCERGIRIHERTPSPIDQIDNHS